jgi:hypothetical protein
MRSTHVGDSRLLLCPPRWNVTRPNTCRGPSTTSPSATLSSLHSSRLYPTPIRNIFNVPFKFIKFQGNEWNFNYLFDSPILYLNSLLLLPNVGPDMKYLFDFIRTQMSTTVTIALVFGPKVNFQFIQSIKITIW